MTHVFKAMELLKWDEEESLKYGWRPLEIDDLRNIKPSKIQADTQRVDTFLEEIHMHDVVRLCSRTWEKDGELLACSGLMPMIPGVADLWSLFSDEALAKPRELFRFCKHFVEFSEKRLSLHRLTACCNAKFPETRRLVEHLGFELEGTIKHLPKPGDEQWLLARYS